jgi:hypothetical protein
MLLAPTTTQDREQRLWSAEVARILALAPTLEPAVRGAVRATLHALAADPSIDEPTRADVIALLSVTDRVALTGRESRTAPVEDEAPLEVNAPDRVARMCRSLSRRMAARHPRSRRPALRLSRKTAGI